MQLREELSDLEHRQWEHWSQTVARELEEVYQLLTPVIKDERAKKARKIIGERLNRWHKNWKPYSDLTENVKEFDREWADKSIKEIQRFIVSVDAPAYLYSSQEIGRKASEETIKLILNKIKSEVSADSSHN